MSRHHQDDRTEELLSRVRRLPPDKRRAFLQSTFEDAELRREVASLLTPAVTEARDPVTTAADPVTTAPDLRTPAADPLAPAADPLAQTTDPLAQATDPLAPAPDPRTPAVDPLAPAPDPRTPAVDPLAQTTDPVAPAADPHHEVTTFTEPATPAAPPLPGAVEQIGPYRLLRIIGEGGMGRVYEAEQHSPVRRRVAVKLIKAGMDSRQVLARFEAERQALALMDHPAIARIYDAGTTAQGHPFFAMEYVEGEPITAYCDRHNLSLRQRIDLFRKVCDGVQHAHEKGVIHRDLKPSNVLVRILDGEPVPTIIDFGIAKATGQPLTEKSMFTQLGALVGTPEYMSPEQAEITGQDVDTRSDVYSLGAMLYELLSGSLPFDTEEVRAVGLDEVRRRIREVEPPKPSTKLTTLGGEVSEETARRRQSTPPVLRRALKGDLDWITMKALEKDRSRRYASPSELSADLGRHLNHEPVLAGPPSPAYRVGKFVRRHRASVVTAALLLVVLVGGLSVALFGLIRARQAEALARQEADAAEQVSDFLTDLFTVSAPSRARGNSITAREILDRGAGRIESDLAGQPKLKARLMGTIGEVYSGLGLYDEARPLLDDALVQHRALLGEDHLMSLVSTNRLAWVEFNEGRFDEAERLWTDGVARARRALGDTHRLTLSMMNALGWLLIEQGNHAEAEPLLTEALASERRVLGEDDPSTLYAMWALGFLCVRDGRLQEAEPLLVGAFEGRRRVLGEDHPGTIDSRNSLGVLYNNLGRHEEAEPLLRENIAINERVYGAHHKVALYSLDNLGVSLLGQRRYSDAEPMFRETLQARLELLGEEHKDTLDSMHLLGLVLVRQGRLAEAEPVQERTFRLRTQVLGEPHKDTFFSREGLAFTYMAQGRFAEAESLLSEGAEIRRRLLGESHPATLKSFIYLAFAVAKQKDRADAEDHYRRVVEARSRVRDTGDADMVNVEYNLACLAALRGHRDEAIAYLRAALERGLSGTWVAEDPDLASLHGEAEFESIVEAARERSRGAASRP